MTIMQVVSASLAAIHIDFDVVLSYACILDAIGYRSRDSSGSLFCIWRFGRQFHELYAGMGKGN